MWAIRVLSGPQAGQIFPLQPGKNMLGRAPTCEIRLASSGVSKEHAQIFITEDKVIISDMNSRNGTFVNGVRIQNQKLNVGDKMMLHDLLIDLLQIPDNAVLNGFARPAVSPFPPSAYGGAGYPSVAHHDHGLAHGANHGFGHEALTDDAGMFEHPLHDEPMAPMRSPGLKGLYETAIDYLETVAMPGIYNFARMIEYRWVLASFVGLYILLVTAVSVVPTLSLIKSSVQEESQRRARTIARNLSAFNRQAIIERNEMSVSVRMAELEDGVTNALIISAKDGSIIAPANLRGSYADKSFVAKARKSSEELVEQIDGSTIGASAPIVGFNPDTNMNTTLGYAVVLYDMSSVVSQQGRAIRLFLQILTISLVLGFLLFLVLVRLIERPLEELNAQLDDALREGRDDLKIDFQYPRLEALAANISSALSRITDDTGGQSPVVVNRDAEAMNLVDMLATAGLALNAIDERVLLSNSSFDRLVGGGLDLRGRPLTDIPDNSLQQNLRDLVNRMRAAPEQIALADLPFMGEPHEIRGQTIMGSDGQPAYYIISIRRAGAEEAA